MVRRQDGDDAGDGRGNEGDGRSYASDGGSDDNGAGNDDSKTPLLYRRGLLAAAGTGGIAGMLGLSGRSRAASNVIDLGEEGLEDGDDVSPYIEEYFRSGNEVRIPAGSYRLSSHAGLQRSLSDAALIGSDDGVEFHRPADPEHRIRPFVKATGGTVRIENITVRGKKGEGQSRWRFDAVDADARIEVVNVNHPDGTVGCSDSFAFYVGKHHEGTVVFKNCYVADMGNSSFYLNQGFDESRHNPVVMDNCVVINANGTSRHGTNGSEIRDCTFVWRDEPNAWTNCSSLARGPRWDNGGEDMVVENCHFCFESDIGSSEGAMKVEDWPLGGVVRDVFIHNETDGEMFRDAGGLDEFTFENIHITGPGRTSSSTVSGVEHDTPPDLRNEDVVWMPESRTVRPGDGSGGRGTSDSGQDDERSDAEEDDDSSMFEVVSTDSDAELGYTFTVDGSAEKAEASADNSSIGESNDAVTDDGDGTATVSGWTGLGYGDAYRVDGEVTSFEKTEGESGFQLLLDGEDVTERLTSDDADPSTFEVVSTDEDADLDYAFTVDGTAEKAEASADNSSIGESNDAVTDDGDGTVTVEGRTGRGLGDAYLVTGSISSFERTDGESGFELLLDGEDVTDRLASGGSAGGDSGEESGPKRVFVDGTAAPEAVNEYRIEVTGEIQPDPERTHLVDGGLPWDALNDVVDGSTAVGVVGNGVDAYTYTGEVVDLTVEGDATAEVED